MSTSADLAFSAAAISMIACLQQAKQAEASSCSRSATRRLVLHHPGLPVLTEGPCLVQAEQAEEYSRTVVRLGTILEERRGKYAFADLQVSLQADQHDKVGLPSAVVAYR